MRMRMVVMNTYIYMKQYNFTKNNIWGVGWGNIVFYRQLKKIISLLNNFNTSLSSTS